MKERIIDKLLEELKEIKESSTQTFDDVISKIEIEGHSKINTMIMLYLAYKLDLLHIFIGEEEYTSKNIHTIDLSRIDNKNSHGSVCFRNGASDLSSVEYKDIYRLIKNEDLDGLCLYYNIRSSYEAM